MREERDRLARELEEERAERRRLAERLERLEGERPGVPESPSPPAELPREWATVPNAGEEEPAARRPWWLGG